MTSATALLFQNIMKLHLNELHFLPAAILPYSNIKEL